MRERGTRRQWLRGGVVALMAGGLSAAAWAANTPCSGKKGGIAHCEEDRFRCNNGTLSASKKSCQAVYRPATQRKQSKPVSAPGAKKTK